MDMVVCVCGGCVFLCKVVFETIMEKHEPKREIIKKIIKQQIMTSKLKILYIQCFFLLQIEPIFVSSRIHIFLQPPSTTTTIIQIINLI